MLVYCGWKQMKFFSSSAALALACLGFVPGVVATQQL